MEAIWYYDFDLYCIKKDFPEELMMGVLELCSLAQDIETDFTYSENTLICYFQESIVSVFDEVESLIEFLAVEDQTKKVAFLYNEAEKLYCLTFWKERFSITFISERLFQSLFRLKTMIIKILEKIPAFSKYMIEKYLQKLISIFSELLKVLKEERESDQTIISIIQKLIHIFQKVNKKNFDQLLHETNLIFADEKEQSYFESLLEKERLEISHSLTSEDTLWDRIQQREEFARKSKRKSIEFYSKLTANHLKFRNPKDSIIAIQVNIDLQDLDELQTEMNPSQSIDITQNRVESVEKFGLMNELSPRKVDLRKARTTMMMNEELAFMKNNLGSYIKWLENQLEPAQTSHIVSDESLELEVKSIPKVSIKPSVDDPKDFFNFKEEKSASIKKKFFNDKKSIAKTKTKTFLNSHSPFDLSLHSSFEKKATQDVETFDYEIFDVGFFDLFRFGKLFY